MVELSSALSVPRGKTPEQYGATGDGATDDTLAIRAAITAAGVNGVIVFKPGATYLTSGQLDLLVGQTVWGYGSKIKRRAQIATTTTEAITNPELDIDVADASNLRVGMNVTFSDSATAQSALVAGTTLSTVNSEITAIVGNTLTLATSPNASLSSGANVYLSFNTIVLNTDCRVLGLEFDGNKANWPWGRWEVTNEMHMATGALRAVVEGCYVHDTPGEGMQVGGYNARVVRNQFKDLNGNGIHFSGASNPLCDGNSVINCNLNTDVGHADGCIIWSNGITDATVVNNYLENGKAGIGSLDSAGNSDVTVSSNTIRSCTGNGIKIEGAAANLTITNNRIYSCGSGATGGLQVLNNTGTGNLIAGNTFVSCSVSITGTSSLAFRGNYLKTGDLTLQSLTDCQVCENTIYGGAILLTGGVNLSAVNDNYVDRTGDTTNNCIYASGTGNLNSSVSRNTCIGGLVGFRISSNGNTDLNVSGNQCRANYAYGIWVDSTGTQAGANIAGNSIVPTTASAASWVGIRIASDGITVKDNHVFSPNSGQANYGIQIDKKTMVLGNAVRGAYNLGSIRIAAGSTDTLVQDNYITTAISDAGTTTTLTNNTTVAA